MIYRERLDYVGITLLIVGSFVPWLYYGFYCEYLAYVIYLSLVITLGVASMIASLGWIILMGVLYIGGAVLYTLRIPERFYPGKCDIWFELSLGWRGFQHHQRIQGLQVKGSVQPELLDEKIVHFQEINQYSS
ncbi:hypothetical protein QYM36_001704 [Artemia franciscana]|uniref:Uncharacterized protein n=1 Tax=Artemia franciscana TaxID=6661 RepID=A0AA88IBM4_ARTSF|nr:hypothetical protein QYM36_001704 [Artemia franciscana]